MLAFYNFDNADDGTKALCEQLNHDAAKGLRTGTGRYADYKTYSQLVAVAVLGMVLPVIALCCVCVYSKFHTEVVNVPADPELHEPLIETEDSRRDRRDSDVTVLEAGLFAIDWSNKDDVDRSSTPPMHSG